MFFFLYISSSQMYGVPVSEIHNQLSVPHFNNAYVPLYSTLNSKAELYNSIKYGAVSTPKNSPIFSVVQHAFYEYWFCRGCTLLRRARFLPHIVWFYRSLILNSSSLNAFHWVGGRDMCCFFSYRACNMLLGCLIFLFKEFVIDHCKSYWLHGLLKEENTAFFFFCLF